MALIIPVGAPSPRSVLGYDGADYYVLRVDATGHAQVDVLASDLPAGAATAAHQVTQNTALQLIDNLVNALQSVATDRLKVRGEDQLFTFKGVLASRNEGAISGAGGYIESGAVPAGEIWVLTNVVATDGTTATTAHTAYVMHDGATVYLYEARAAYAADVKSSWGGHAYLDVGDTVRVYFTGGLVADTVRVDILGHRMTVEV